MWPVSFSWNWLRIEQQLVLSTRFELWMEQWMRKYLSSIHTQLFINLCQLLLQIKSTDTSDHLYLLVKVYNQRQVVQRFLFNVNIRLFFKFLSRFYVLTYFNLDVFFTSLFWITWICLRLRYDIWQPVNLSTVNNLSKMYI